MKKRTLFAFLFASCCSLLLAQDNRDHAQVSLTYPGKLPPPIGSNQIVVVVVDGPLISYEKSPIPSDQVVPLLNGILKEKNVSAIGVYVRAGSKYGEVVRAVDVLRQTQAKSIGVSVMELPPGRDP